MTCQNCGYPSTIAGQACPSCGTVQPLPGRPEGASSGRPLAAPAAAASGVPGFLPPSAPVPGQPAVATILEPSPTPARRRRWPVLAGAIAALVLIGGGVAAALVLGWFRGASPAEVLPGNAVAYLRADINPTAAQKVAAFQFLQGLPELENLGSDADSRRLLWDWAASNSNGDLDGIDYATQIEPWLGDRMAIAIIPGSGTDAEPVTVLAIEASDENEAKSLLPEVVEQLAKGASFDITYDKGYAVVAEAKDAEQVASALAVGRLADTAAFKEATADLADPGVLSVWGDIAAVQKILPDLAETPVMAEGSFAAAVRFSADALETEGVLRDLEPAYPAPAEGGLDLATLPADTAVAMNLRGGSDAVEASWDDIEAQSGPFGPIEGIVLPDDLMAFFGDSLTLVASTEAVASFSGDVPPTEFGLIITGDDTARVKELADVVLPSIFGGYAEPVASLDGDTVTIAGSQAYEEELTRPTGTRLGEVPGFARAVEDPATADNSFYIDLRAFHDLVLDSGGEQAARYETFLRSLVAVGGATHAEEDSATVVYRVVRQ